MEDTLITLETAKLAKEKGFHIKTKSYYKITGPSTFTQEKEVDHNDDLRNNLLNNNTFSAPTQSLLAKWLREVHNIDANATRCSNCNCKKYGYGVYENGEYSLESNPKFNTYEEALEQGLTQSLKLIP